MTNLVLNDIATAQVTDACVRLKVPFRIAPAGITPIFRLEKMLYGKVVPVRHYGSVDIFLEVLESCSNSGILVIDNSGRRDEACIGDLVALEVKNVGLSAIVIWGLHRDTADLRMIGLPVLSYGAYPSGPTRLDARDLDALTHAHFGDFVVTEDDTVFVDDDGAIFIATRDVEQVIALAGKIRETERVQAAKAQDGLTLRDQFQFRTYLDQRSQNSDYTFRKHLSQITKSIEE